MCFGNGEKKKMKKEDKKAREEAYRRQAEKHAQWLREQANYMNNMTQGRLSGQGLGLGDPSAGLRPAQYDAEQAARRNAANAAMIQGAAKFAKHQTKGKYNGAIDKAADMAAKRFGSGHDTAPGTTGNDTPTWMGVAGRIAATKR